MPYIVSYSDCGHRVAVIVADLTAAIPFATRPGVRVHELGRRVPDLSLAGLCRQQRERDVAEARATAVLRARAFAKLDVEERAAVGLATCGTPVQEQP